MNTLVAVKNWEKSELKIPGYLQCTGSKESALIFCTFDDLCMNYTHIISLM